MNKKFQLIILASAFTFTAPTFAQYPKGGGWATEVYQPAPQPQYDYQQPSNLAPVTTGELGMIYKQLGGSALWTGSSAAERRLFQFMNFLPNIESHGLRLLDYNFNELYTYRNQNPAFEADFSKEVLRLAKDVSIGRLNPMTIKEVYLKRRAFNINGNVINFFNAPSAAAFSSIAPQHPAYRDLVELLARLRAENQRGGFAGIKTLPATMKLGTVSQDVYNVKAILNFYGFNLYLDSNFDTELDAAIKKIQKANMGAQDGIVSPKNTDALAFLKVDSFNRQLEVELTMEKLRWLPENLGYKHVFVNTAIQELTVVDPNLEVTSPIRLQKTINGKVDRQTPTLMDHIITVVINPTWTLPPTILNDKLKLIKDAYMTGGIDAVRSFLQEKRFSLFVRGGNTKMDASEIDWMYVTAQDAPFHIVQATGFDNTLGLVKFLLTDRNNLNIYLHDTDSRQLFRENNRLLSSGCVRIERPLEFAAYLLQGTEWTADKINQTVATHGQRDIPQSFVKVPAEMKLPVYLMPLTAFKKEGQFYFTKDMYGQNKLLFNALKRAKYYREYAGAVPTPAHPFTGVY